LIITKKRVDDAGFKLKSYSQKNNNEVIKGNSRNAIIINMMQLCDKLINQSTAEFILENSSLDVRKTIIKYRNLAPEVIARNERNMLTYLSLE
jgi:hypothetical protein